MPTLQGKVALVTGAASGIGRASALLFAAEGAAVVALDRSAEVESTVSAIRSAGGRAVALVKDSSAEVDVAGAVSVAVEAYGGLDVCYANAGISGGLVPFFEETVERWTEVLKINLIGARARLSARLPSPACVRAPAACPTAPARPESSAWCKPPPTSLPEPACASTPFVQV
jgi:NAD(P)-dependent dehydrogenase (short-subunit alcohol dehydrogenase family)